MQQFKKSIGAFALAIMLAALTSAQAQQKTITVASTTSTEQSGLFGFLWPAFTKKTGIEVPVVAVGTGQALDIGRRGDADVVFVHDKAAEEKFLAEGGSTKGAAILAAWEQKVPHFVKVMPKDYKRMLACIDKAQAQGLTGDEAIMAAFEENAHDLARVGGN